MVRRKVSHPQARCAGQCLHNRRGCRSDRRCSKGSQCRRGRICRRSQCPSRDHRNSASTRKVSRDPWRNLLLECRLGNKLMSQRRRKPEPRISGLPEAIRLLKMAAKKSPRRLGRILSREDASGHTLLCRLFSEISSYGPRGTFASVDKHKLESGGNLCTFGVWCGSPTESYTRQMFERLEHLHRTTQILVKMGALQSHVWENPNFSASSLCRCGKSDDSKFSSHDPLCPYRVKHHMKVTIDEYKAALGRVQ